MSELLTKFGLGILVIGLIIFGINLSLFLSQMAAMHPVASGKVTEQVTAVKNLFVNLYLITDGTNTVAIDAGSNLNQVKRELAKLGIPPEKVLQVFLTHSDADHTGALKLFSKAQVYLSHQEEALIKGKVKRHGIIKNKIGTSDYRLLTDGDVIESGKIRIQAIATPGHTPGSMSYLVNDRILFTGDLLGLAHDKAVVFSPHFFNMDETTIKKSLAKLARLENIATLYTGHHGVSHDFKQAIAEWR
ncbi:MAG TPA: MBL fold metallo-hydrolase [Bacillota bacterium]|nr:MBL fold metallo-hydrolase [Bacillota bacterium]